MGSNEQYGREAGRPNRTDSSVSTENGLEYEAIRTMSKPRRSDSRRSRRRELVDPEEELQRAATREAHGTADIDLATTLAPRRTASRNSAAGSGATIDPLPPPPDGGSRAWTQVAMGWMVIFATWGYVNSFGSFQAYYNTSLAPLSPSDIAWIGSVQTWLTFIVGAFSGRLLDAGYFFPTFLTGAVLHLLGVFLMSVSTKFWQLMLTQGILTGFGGGIIFTPSMALVATYFSSRRGLAVGIATTGNSAGGIIYPIVVRELLPKVGFGWAARTLGFINLAFFCLVLTFMKPRLPPRRSGPVIDWPAFREPVYDAYVVGLFFFYWMGYFVFSFTAAFGQEILGMSYHEASLLVTIVNGVGMPFRVLVPMLADRIGPINVISVVGICYSIISFMWLAVTDRTGMYIFTVFFGITVGVLQSLMPTAFASITERLDMVGTRLGMALSILSFAGLTGPPLGGALLAANGGSYTAAQGWAAGSSVICAVAWCAARVINVGWGWKNRC